MGDYENLYLSTTFRTRDPTVRITEAVVSEKATIIRLNRALKEKNQQIADLQFQLNRLSTVSSQRILDKLAGFVLFDSSLFAGRNLNLDRNEIHSN